MIIDMKPFVTFAVSHLHIHIVATYASVDKQYALRRNPTVQIPIRGKKIKSMVWLSFQFWWSEKRHVVPLRLQRKGKPLCCPINIV